MPVEQSIITGCWCGKKTRSLWSAYWTFYHLELMLI